ncbi:MAG: hypothetical protein AAFW95_00055, partial [Cyanobacteria bacterium J06638_6]
MDKISDLLLKLLEIPALVLLFCGVFLIIIGGSEKIPISNDELILSEVTKLILLALGLILTLSSFFLLLKDKFRPKSSQESRLESHEIQKFKAEENKIEGLENIIKEVKIVVESRSDETSLLILDILNGVKDQAREFERAAQESRLAAKWLTSEQEHILHSLDLSGGNNKSASEFKAEIREYLNLVIESLERFKYIAPSARNIGFHLHNPFPYMQAMKNLSMEIQQEFHDHGVLKESELKRLIGCIDQLREVIRKESSH